MSGSTAQLKYRYDQIMNQINKETKPMKYKCNLKFTIPNSNDRESATSQLMACYSVFNSIYGAEMDLTLQHGTNNHLRLTADKKSDLESILLTVLKGCSKGIEFYELEWVEPEQATSPTLTISNPATDIIKQFLDDLEYRFTKQYYYDLSFTSNTNRLLADIKDEFAKVESVTNDYIHDMLMNDIKKHFPSEFLRELSKPKPTELETFYETFTPFCDKYGIKLRGLQYQMAEHIMIYRSKGVTYDEQFHRQYGKTFLGLVLCAWFAETFPDKQVLINQAKRSHAIGAINKLRELGITPQPKNLYVYTYRNTNDNHRDTLTSAGSNGMVFNDDADFSGKCQLTNKTFCLSSPMNPLDKLK